MSAFLPTTAASKLEERIDGAVLVDGLPVRLVLSVPMAPYAWPRPHAAKRGGIYMPKAAKEAKMELQTHLIRLTAGLPPMEGPVRFDYTFFRAIKRDNRKNGDGDNYEKWLWDSAIGILFVDDRQITKWSGEIDEAEVARVDLTLESRR